MLRSTIKQQRAWCLPALVPPGAATIDGQQQPGAAPTVVEGSLPVAIASINAQPVTALYNADIVVDASVHLCAHVLFCHGAPVLHNKCCSVAVYYSVLRRDVARSQHVCLVRI